MIAPGIYFGIWAVSSFSGVLLIIVLSVIALLSLAFCLFTLDGIEGKMIIDAEGIEWRSPIKKKRLLWNEGLQFRERNLAFKGGVTRIFDVSSANTIISFGENLRNHRYLIALIDAGINGRADHNSEVALPLAPLDINSTKDTVNSLLMVAVLSLIGSVVIGLMSFDEGKILYFIPSVSVKNAAKYADKYTDIKLQGKLHAVPPAVSRDKQHTYGLQYVQLENPTQTVENILSASDFELLEGTDKISVKVPFIPPTYFGKPSQTTFRKDWQKSDVGKTVIPGFDDIFKDYAKALPNEDHQLLVWNIDQDSPVESIGRVKTENGALYFKPTETGWFWLAPSPNKKLEQDFLIKAIAMGAAFALSMYTLVAAYLELKRAS